LQKNNNKKPHASAQTSSWSLGAFGFMGLGRMIQGALLKAEVDLGFPKFFLWLKLIVKFLSITSSL
jgi:hypothetical protein